MGSAGAGPRAVLWDFDGTLVDTEPYWIEAERALAGAHGADWTQAQAMQLVGNDLLESGRLFREQTGVPLSASEIVDSFLDHVVERVSVEVPWRPGARELLEALRQSAVPCALVTMSYRRLVDPVLAALPADSFRAVITGDSVTSGKPHPEAYLVAADRLGFPPRSCLAIEDSDTGARSAESAGCRVLVVPNHVRVPAGPARSFLDSLEGVGPGTLAALTAPS